MEKLGVIDDGGSAEKEMLIERYIELRPNRPHVVEALTKMSVPDIKKWLGMLVNLIDRDGNVLLPPPPVTPFAERAKPMTIRMKRPEEPIPTMEDKR